MSYMDQTNDSRVGRPLMFISYKLGNSMDLVRVKAHDVRVFAASKAFYGEGGGGGGGYPWTKLCKHAIGNHTTPSPSSALIILLDKTRQKVPVIWVPLLKHSR